MKHPGARIHPSGIVRAFFVFSLFASVTNFVPLSISFAALLLTLPCWKPVVRADRLTASLALLYVYFALSAFLYHPASLLEPEFYRRDGNFFVTYLPLVIFGFWKINAPVEDIIRRFAAFSAVITAACMILPRMGVNPGGIVVIEGGEQVGTVNHFLFEAHNAAGGFLAVVSCLCLGLVLAERRNWARRRLLLAMVIHLAALYDSASRGTMLAVAAALGISFIERRNIRDGRDGFVLDRLLFFAAVIANYLLVAMLTSKELLEKVVGLLHISKRVFAVNDRLSNVWPRARMLIRESPLFGTGFGSFNDNLPLEQLGTGSSGGMGSYVIRTDLYQLRSGLGGLVKWNHPDAYVYSSGHAHNTFLHVAAETGGVGLALTISLVGAMRGRILKLRSEGLRRGLYLALCVNVASSFTEHRLFTPSQMLPFLIVLGMAVSRERVGGFG